MGSILSHLRVGFPPGPAWVAPSEVIPCIWKVGVGKTVHHYLTYLYFDGFVINLNLIHIYDLSMTHAVYRQIGKATEMLPLLWIHIFF